MKYLMLLFLTACMKTTNASEPQINLNHPDTRLPDNIITDIKSSGLSDKEKISRNSAVKVISGKGHGSGAIVKYKNVYLIMTAQHVTSGPIGSTYLIIAPSGESKYGQLIYSDKNKDIAFLHIRKFKSRVAAKYTGKYDLPEVGARTIYSGFPSSFSLLSVRGDVIGYAKNKLEENVILLKTFGWFGSSGSIVFDDSGNIMGVISGISIEYSPTFQIQEDILWVMPASHVDNITLVRNICKANKYFSLCR